MTKAVMDGVIMLMLTGCFCAAGALLGFTIMWSRFEKWKRDHYKMADPKKYKGTDARWVFINYWEDDEEVNHD